MNLIAKVEISAGSSYKYEFNKFTGTFILDRVLNQKVPYNYGYFIYSNTQADGDQLDVFICSQYPIPQGTECTVKIVGGFKCLDQGIEDNKIIAVLEGEDYYINKYSIQQYLSTYKQGFEVLGNLTEDEIKEILK